MLINKERLFTWVESAPSRSIDQKHKKREREKEKAWNIQEDEHYRIEHNLNQTQESHFQQKNEKK